jgi:hypothetical protein
MRHTHANSKPESKVQQPLGVAVADARPIVVAQWQAVQKRAGGAHRPEGVAGRKTHPANGDLHDEVVASPMCPTMIYSDG